MMLIPCPWCGPRDDSEFAYGNQAHIARPNDPLATSDQQWAEYLYFRDNPKGPFAERWMHAAGCRRWFHVVRDTYSHVILQVYKVGEWPDPALGVGPASKES
ncbi:sarcosine oxidase subunit delta [Thalassobaculum sp.]|uniref:sarcosine oxidase subunit delta n=1 Tax=Thalassobaculum sp. TaxID=2022740 RepID=UPI0032ED0A1B